MAKASSAQAILRVVLELLETGGYDAVQLREVAQRARVSLTTIYRLFPTRDELIVAALQEWMTANSASPLATPPAGESVRDGLVRVFRHVFEPWERSPRMLEAYHRARVAPGGRRLDQHAAGVILPVSLAVLQGLDPGYAEDIGLVLSHMTDALVGRFVAGQIAVTEILPILTRTVDRLTSDNEALAERRTAAAQRRGLSRQPLAPDTS